MTNAAFRAMRDDPQNVSSQATNGPLGFLGSLGLEAALMPAATSPQESTWNLPTTSERIGQFWLWVAGNMLRSCPRENGCLWLRGYVVSETNNDQLSRIVQNDDGQQLESGSVLRTGCCTMIRYHEQQGRLSLYRNLVGNGFTYYVQFGGALVFGSNLAQLAAFLRTLGWIPRVNEARLPVFFLYRAIPGRETLFRDVFRLMPGEQITFDLERGLRRTQVDTLGGLYGDPFASRGDSLNSVMDQVLNSCADFCPHTTNTLSGGVDSSYIQARWNTISTSRGVRPSSFGISVPHPKTREDQQYALSAAEALGHSHSFVPANLPYIRYLESAIRATAEPPNHVQSAYFGHLAKAIGEEGFRAALCGEGADSLFGMGLVTDIQVAEMVRRFAPLRWQRRLLHAAFQSLGRHRWARRVNMAERVRDLDFRNSTINEVASFANWTAAADCFGNPALADAVAYRNQLLVDQRIPDQFLHQMHAIGYLAEAVDSASLWTTLFATEGCHLLCPFLDNRLVRFALTLPDGERFRFRQPKHLLKQSLAGHVSRKVAFRRKLGFGQPIFEWMSPGGQLRPWIEEIAHYSFIDDDQLAAAKQRPDWWLFSLLCFDIWHKVFIDNSTFSWGTMEA